MNCRLVALMVQMDQYGFHCGTQKYERVEIVSDLTARFFPKHRPLKSVTEVDGYGPLFQVAVLCFPTLIMGDHHAISTFFTN